MGGGMKILRSWFTASWRGMSTTATATATTPVKVEKKELVLFRRLASIGLENSDANVGDVLDDWEKDGFFLKRPQALSFASQLRRFNKPHLALQLYQWMDKTKKQLNNADRAIRVDLLFKTEGITSAENYFNGLDPSAKTHKTYGALLSCYCREQMADKAIELFQKMKELNFHAHALNYNNMMTLYMKVGLPGKVPVVYQEMKANNIAPELYTYNQLMNSYAALEDINAVEGVLETMKSENIKFDWFTFGNLANIYLNAGLMDKAKGALEELEKQKISKEPQAFQTLINLYSRSSDFTGVARAWELCKSKLTKPKNPSYLVMHLALSSLGDYDGLEKLYTEWKSVRSNDDVRISNVLLESYVKRGMIEEANLLYDSIITSGVHLNLRTHSSFVDICLKKKQINLALQSLAVAASKITLGKKSDWFPRHESVDAFVGYFEKEKDVVSARKFGEIMKSLNRLDAETEKILNELCSS